MLDFSDPNVITQFVKTFFLMVTTLTITLLELGNGVHTGASSVLIQ